MRELNEKEEAQFAEFSKKLIDKCIEIATKYQGLQEFKGRFVLSDSYVNPDVLVIGINPGANTDYAPDYDNDEHTRNTIRKERFSSHREHWHSDKVFRSEEQKEGIINMSVKKCFSQQVWDNIVSCDNPRIVHTNLCPIATKDEKELKSLYKLDPNLKPMCIEWIRNYIDLIQPRLIIVVGKSVMIDTFGGCELYVSTKTAFHNVYKGIPVIGFSRIHNCIRKSDQIIIRQMTDQLLLSK